MQSSISFWQNLKTSCNLWDGFFFFVLNDVDAILAASKYVAYKCDVAKVDKKKVLQILFQHLDCLFFADVEVCSLFQSDI